MPKVVTEIPPPAVQLVPVFVRWSVKPFLVVTVVLPLVVQLVVVQALRFKSDAKSALSKETTRVVFFIAVMI